MHRAAAVLAIALAATGAGAQEAYKCRDHGSRVTYSDKTCEKLGLRLVGVVGERISVIAVPGRRDPVRDPAPAAPPAAAPDTLRMPAARVPG